ncbi:MAG: glutamate 5-kinase [Polyangiales bacterium]
MSVEERRILADARRVVVKIGSRSLMAEGGRRFTEIASQIAEQRAKGRSVVLVSSGAVAAGRQRLGFTERPKELPKLQAAAAAGQSHLMRTYEDAFGAHGVVVAQVLLTHADLADRERYLNARGALEAMLELGVVPIINENDTVSVDELKFGDNDQLAALVAALIGADLLVLLTDVEGLLDPEGKRVPVVTDLQQAMDWVRPPTDDVGLGGMASKVEAARRATLHGIPCVIGDARDASLLSHITSGEDVGTVFLPKGATLPSKKHWIAFTLKPKGSILVDRGAAAVLAQGKSSLLPSGVIGVRGDFDVGDAVTIVDPDGKEIARGLARYGVYNCARLAGAKSTEIGTRIGQNGGDVIVHKDELVVL